MTLHFVHFDHLAFGLTSSAQLLFSSKVALLSARIQEITAPDKAITERINDPDAPLEDDALKPHIDKTEDAETQVITQLEVLYDLEQSYINGEDKTLKQSSVMVGKFEACLRGIPLLMELAAWLSCAERCFSKLTLAAVTESLSATSTFSGSHKNGCHNCH